MDNSSGMTREQILEAWKKDCAARTSSSRRRHPKQSHSGKRADLGGVYLRSRFEANVWRWLAFLKQIEVVESFEYEPETFWFRADPKRRLRGITHGPAMFYKPDFKVVYKEDHRTTYLEVKGWMDPVSKTKLKRMRLYHPDVVIVVIDHAAYKAIQDQVCRTIPNWE